MTRHIALGYAAIFALSSLLLVGVLWWRTAAYLDQEVDAVILADVRAIGDRLRDFGLPGAIETINDRVGKAGDEHAIYLLADPALVPVAGNLDAWPLTIGPRQGWLQISLSSQNRIHATRVLSVELPAHYQLLVGRDVQDRVALRRLILDGLGWATATALLLAMGGGLLLRRAILRRVEAITGTASAIMQGDLSSRLATRNTSDEFDRLAQTINGMLGQIEILIDGVRNASNAVAHDLRTPLAQLRGRLEAMLRTRPSAEQALLEVAEAVADLDQVISVFNALLRLAEIESGARLAQFGTVRLDLIAAEVAELYGPVAEEKRQAFTLAITPGLTVVGDAVLLAQAIGNLLDNAIKFAPPEGVVSLTLCHSDDGRIMVVVADNGPGIPDEDKPRVTDRFYRGAAGADTAGTGLGLSLVAAVSRLHGGELTLRDHCPGLIASLGLPCRGRLAQTGTRGPQKSFVLSGSCRGCCGRLPEPSASAL